MTKNEYSLWLRPAQTQIDEFTEIISSLAHHHRTVPFAPHLTLLSGINCGLHDIKQYCAKFVGQYEEFDIPLQKMDYTETYYRNFFIVAEATQQLSKMYEDTKNAFACKTHEVFMPHLSVLYGNIEIKTKQKLKEELENTYAKLFHCQRLDIYNTTGDVANWHLVKSYSVAKTKI